MPDSDDTLKMLIDLKVVRTEDAEAAKDLLAQTTTAAGDLAKATEQLGKVSAAAAGGVEQVAASSSELEQVIGVVKQASPGLGEALSNAAKGPIGTISLGMEAYQMLQAQIDEMNAESDKQGASNAKPEGAGIAGVQQAWDGAAESLGKYKAALITAGDDNDPIGTEIKRTKELTTAKIEGEKSVAEAKGKQEEETLRQNNATPAELAAASAQTQAKIDALDETERVATGSGSLKSEQATRAALNAKLQKEAADASEVARHAAVKHNNDAAFLEHARDALGQGPEGKDSEAAQALQKKVDDANAGLIAAKNEPYSLGGPIDGPPMDNTVTRAKDIAEAETNVKTAQGELDARKTEVTHDEAREAASDAVYELAQSVAKAAQDAAVHNQERLGQLPDEINQALEVEKIKRENTSQIQPVNPVTSPQAGAGANSASRLAGINENDQSVERLNLLLMSITANQQAMLGMMNNFIDGQSVIAEEIQSLTNKYKLVQDQIREVQTFGIR